VAYYLYFVHRKKLNKQVEAILLNKNIMQYYLVIHSM